MVTPTSLVPASRSREPSSSTSLPSTWKVAREVSELGATTKVIVYSEVVSPSAAVTVTTRVFSPVTRPTSPETTTVASASVVSTFTSTSVVPLSSSMTSPSETSSSLIVIEETEASSEAGTFRVTA